MSPLQYPFGSQRAPALACAVAASQSDRRRHFRALAGWPLRGDYRGFFLWLDAISWPGWGTLCLNNRRFSCLKEHQNSVPWCVEVWVHVFPLPASFVNLMGNSLLLGNKHKFEKHPLEMGYYYN